MGIRQSDQVCPKFWTLRKMTRNYCKFLLEIFGGLRYDYGAMVSGEVHPKLCKKMEKLEHPRLDLQCSFVRPMRYYLVKESE